MFARKRDDGNYDILHEDGSAAFEKMSGEAA